MAEQENTSTSSTASTITTRDKREGRSAEITRLLGVMDEIGLSVVLDKARDIAKQYPRDKALGEVIRFPRQGGASCPA